MCLTLFVEGNKSTVLLGTLYPLFCVNLKWNRISRFTTSNLKLVACVPVLSEEDNAVHYILHYT